MTNNLAQNCTFLKIITVTKDPCMAFSSSIFESSKQFTIIAVLSSKVSQT